METDTVQNEANAEKAALPGYARRGPPYFFRA